MSHRWTSGYVIGPCEALKQWELGTWPNGRPHSAFRADPAYPLIQDGTTVDEETQVEYPIYIHDPDRDDVLVLFSVQPEEMDYLTELDAMDGVTVRVRATRESILAEFPDFAVGQSIPHIS